MSPYCGPVLRARDISALLPGLSIYAVAPFSDNITPLMMCKGTDDDHNERPRNEHAQNQL